MSGMSGEHGRRAHRQWGRDGCATGSIVFATPDLFMRGVGRSFRECFAPLHQSLHRVRYHAMKTSIARAGRGRPCLTKSRQRELGRRIRPESA